MKMIPFFTDDITIDVTESNYVGFVAKKITLLEFNRASNSFQFSLYEHENGEYEYRDKAGTFIKGFSV